MHCYLNDSLGWKSATQPKEPSIGPNNASSLVQVKENKINTEISERKQNKKNRKCKKVQ